jgi:hypothetical protein
MPDNFKWAALNDEMLSIESKDGEEYGNYSLQIQVRLREFPLSTPLLVKIPVTIFALSEDIPPPRVITKQSMTAWVLVGILAVIMLIVGFFIGCKYE